VNALLKQIQNKPNDVSLIYKLENHIKDNWKFFSPEREYNYLAFNEVFSRLLEKFDSKLSGQKKFNKFEIVNYFKDEYRSYFDKVNRSVAVLDDVVHEEVVKTSNLILTDLSIADKLILFRYLSNPELPKSERLILILSKVRYKTEINDEDIMDIISKTNYPSLFLIKHLGIPKYLEFTNLITKLGIYYPIVNVSDDKLVIDIKSQLLNSFKDSLNGLSIKDVSLIESLIFEGT
jgi:hypothetical protein